MLSMGEQEFKQFTEFLRYNYGINLSKKKSLIEGRLSNMLMEKGYDNFSEYLNYVYADCTKQEMTTLINKLTTNHTFFMREFSHFEFFRDKILPYITPRDKERDLRIWSAGCSTGEEPYTLAMVMADYFAEEHKAWNTKMLATDISVNVLQAAEKGEFAAEGLQDIPTAWKVNYFSKVENETYRVKDKIRDEVIFRVFNLMDEVFPFKQKFHVIFCRNVMIYFDDEIKLKLLKKLYEATEPGGYLFIGHAESISKYNTGYRYVLPAVYRKG